MLEQHQGTAQYEQTGQTHVQIASPQEKLHDYEEAISILASKIRGPSYLIGMKEPETQAHREFFDVDELNFVLR